jgi:hypothetical protein
MTVTALEILVNGKKLYVVGMRGWQMLGANVQGHKHTPEMMAKVREQVGTLTPGMSEEDLESLSLHCYVGLPDPKRPGSSHGQNYGVRALAIGDEITIRVIETDDPDSPLPPSDSNRGFGIVIGSSDDDPE